MGSWRLLAPSGLWLLALIAPLVVLYILRVRRKRAKVSSTWLWSAHARDLLARSPFRRLIAQLSLLLQILFLVLMALALAQPSTLGAEVRGRHVAIVIDASASMAAADGDATRMERARKAALDVLDALPPDSLAMVIVAQTAPRVASPLDRDLRRVADVVDRVQAAEVEGDLAGAVAMAIDKTRSFEDAKVIVITDGAVAKPLGLTAPAVPIEIVRVGEPADNVAIVRADVRAGVDPVTGADQARGFLLVESFAEVSREIFVTMRRAGEADVLDARRVMIEPGEKTPIVLTMDVEPSDEGAALVFDVSPHDALEVDDVAFGVVPPTGRLEAVLTQADSAEPSPWIERALGSDPRLSVKRVPLASMVAAEIGASTLVVAERVCPPEDVPGSDLVIVAPPKGTCFGVTVGDAAEGPLLTSWDEADARMRFLSFDGVSIAKAAPLTPPSPSMALLRSRAGALISDASTPSRTVTIVGFDPGESDWPLKASFVLFVRNVTELARSHRAQGAAAGARTGEALRVAVPTDARDVIVRDPSGASVEVSSRAGSVIIPSASKTGFYDVRFTTTREERRPVAVNLTSAAESDLRARLEVPPSDAVVVREATAAPQRYEDHAWILALVALAALLVEVWYVSRRPKPSPRKVAEERG